MLKIINFIAAATVLVILIIMDDKQGVSPISFFVFFFAGWLLSWHASEVAEYFYTRRNEKIKRVTWPKDLM